MTSMCPNGHSSKASDYCDICGSPIQTVTAPARSVLGDSIPGLSEGVDVSCPHCEFRNEARALFCEECGYDFTTGSLPFAQSIGPSQEVAGASEPRTSAPASPSQPAENPDEVVAEHVAVASSVSGGPGWLAEVWVDPEWYTAQRATAPIPSVGPPLVVALRERSLLVGRPSGSRGLIPDIDCTPDASVSRRHCQLTTDGFRWWVEDLQSSNGTYLSTAGDRLPTHPVGPGQRHEVGEDDRIYLGAWTRIVVRQALPGEV